MKFWDSKRKFWDLQWKSVGIIVIFGVSFEKLGVSNEIVGIANENMGASFAKYDMI